MIQVSQIQIQKRFQKISPVLQDALFSPKTAETINKIALKNHLPEEKASVLAELVGLVFLGFIHSQDLSHEIKNELKIDSQLATTLANDVQARLFNPFSSEIDKLHLLPPEEESTLIVEEIRKPESFIEKQELLEKEAPEASGSIEVREEEIKIKEVESKIDETLSKIQKAAEGTPVFFGTTPQEESVAPVVIPTTESSLDTSGLETPISPAKPEIQETPILIHEESSAVPVAATPKFRLKISSLFSKLGISSKPKIPPPPKPAEIELGPPPPPPPSNLGEENQPKNEAAEVLSGAELVAVLPSTEFSSFPSSSPSAPAEEKPATPESEISASPPEPEIHPSPEPLVTSELTPPKPANSQPNEASFKVVNYESKEPSDKDESFSQQPNFILAPKATEEKTPDDIILPHQEIIQTETKSELNQSTNSKFNFFKKFFSLFPKKAKTEEVMLPPSPPTPPLPPPPPPPHF